MKRFAVLLMLLIGAVLFAAELEFELDGSYDGSRQKFAAFVPDDAGDKPLPLLVYVHFMGGDRNSARKLGFYEAAAKRGWLVVAPELHGKNTGGATSCAALEAQHDVMDAIDYMKKNYKVDDKVIYIAGRSMGGQLTQLMLAKYPDVFAAGVAGQGCGDLSRLDELAAWVAPHVRKECGEDPFEYERRSSCNYASNFAYVPLILWHGTNDGVVSCKQTERLCEAILPYQPYQRPVFWIQNGSHLSQCVSAEWVCEQLEPYQNSCDISGMKFRWYPELKLTTDEAKKFFYLDVAPRESGKFARVHTSLAGDFAGSALLAGANSAERNPVTMKIAADNVAELTVNLDEMPEAMRPSKYVLRVSGNAAEPAVKVFQVLNGEKSVPELEIEAEAVMTAD